MWQDAHLKTGVVEQEGRIQLGNATAGYLTIVSKLGQVVLEHIFSKYLLRFFKTDFFKVFGKVQLAKSRKKNQFTSLILAWLSIMYKLCFLDTALRLIGLI